jgi:hypothetical protein
MGRLRAPQQIYLRKMPIRALAQRGSGWVAIEIRIIFTDASAKASDFEHCFAVLNAGPQLCEG